MTETKPRKRLGKGFYQAVTTFGFSDEQRAKAMELWDTPYPPAEQATIDQAIACATHMRQMLEQVAASMPKAGALNALKQVTEFEKSLRYAFECDTKG